MQEVEHKEQWGWKYHGGLMGGHHPPEELNGELEPLLNCVEFGGAGEGKKRNSKSHKQMGANLGQKSEGPKGTGGKKDGEK